MKLLSMVVIIVLLSFQNCYCQKKSQVGISFQLEELNKESTKLDFGDYRLNNAKTSFLFGINYERRLTKRSGIAIECKFRKVETMIPINGIANNFNVPFEENIISIPVLYKFTSNIINFSLGPTVEYLEKAWEAENEYGMKLNLSNAYYTNNKRKFSMGAQVKVSKSIRISNDFVIEPGLYYNPILSYKRDYFGMSMSVGYKF